MSLRRTSQPIFGHNRKYCIHSKTFRSDQLSLANNRKSLVSVQSEIDTLGALNYQMTKIVEECRKLKSKCAIKVMKNDPVPKSPKFS